MKEDINHSLLSHVSRLKAMGYTVGRHSLYVPVSSPGTEELKPTRVYVYRQDYMFVDHACHAGQLYYSNVFFLETSSCRRVEIALDFP